MKNQRKTEIDAIWRDSRVWTYFEQSSKGHPSTEIFLDIDKYNGTALGTPILALEYEEEQVARKIGATLGSWSEVDEYLKTFSDSMINVFYQTGFDGLLYKWTKES